MRRALRILLLATVALALLAAGSGVLTARAWHRALADRAAPGPPDTGPAGLLHVVAGDATAAAASLAASVAFIIGLHGLLEPRGRRLPAALLFILSPALMGLALAADISAYGDWQEAGNVGDRAPFDSFLHVHALVLSVPLVGVAIATLGAAAWVLRRGPGERDE